MLLHQSPTVGLEPVILYRLYIRERLQFFYISQKLKYLGKKIIEKFLKMRFKEEEYTTLNFRKSKISNNKIIHNKKVNL